MLKHFLKFILLSSKSIYTGLFNSASIGNVLTSATRQPKGALAHTFVHRLNIFSCNTGNNLVKHTSGREAFLVVHCLVQSFHNPS